MREIKYRIYRISKYLTGYLKEEDYESICINNKGKVCISRGCDGGSGDLSEIDYNDYFSEEYILEQYTGLKDKNGKDIYEGDIVNFIEIYERHFESPCVISFMNHGWYPFIFGTPMPNDIEIIGNIHEHKHLLENPEHKKLLEN